jgi:hypothetical protein
MHDLNLFCVGVMYSGEYDACDVTLSVYPHRASLKNMPVHNGNRTYDLASPLTVLEFEYLADLWPCARHLVFKLHFSYFLNMHRRGCLHDGRWDDFWCIEISHQVKQKFKCLLTELKYCREDLVVQEDYYCCLNNFSFTVNYINLSLENNEVFCWIVHSDLFQYIEIIPPHISSWQSEIIKTAPYSANCACCLSSLGGGAALSLR